MNGIFGCNSCSWVLILVIIFLLSQNSDCGCGNVGGSNSGCGNVGGSNSGCGCNNGCCDNDFNGCGCGCGCN